jgi:DNA-binding NarL/FixJ family response regulator
MTRIGHISVTHQVPDVCSTGKMAEIQLLLADAHAATLAGLRMALSGEPFTIVAAVADADEAVAVAVAERPDVCVLDADMPGGAAAATGEITRRCEGTEVVVLGSERDDATMLEVVRAGAMGYLLKEMDPERLRYAIIGVTKGEAALPRTLVARLMLEFRLRERRRALIGTARLTHRELDVLELLADGAPTRAAAEALGISDVTVRRHISTAIAKLGVADRAAAIALLREG